jgi:hypothetical protein
VACERQICAKQVRVVKASGKNKYPSRRPREMTPASARVVYGFRCSARGVSRSGLRGPFSVLSRLSGLGVSHPGFLSLSLSPSTCRVEYYRSPKKPHTPVSRARTRSPQHLARACSSATTDKCGRWPQPRRGCGLALEICGVAVGSAVERRTAPRKPAWAESARAQQLPPSPLQRRLNGSQQCIRSADCPGRRAHSQTTRSA